MKCTWVWCHGLTASYPGSDALFDSYGIYKLENGIYVNVNPAIPSVSLI